MLPPFVIRSRDDEVMGRLGSRRVDHLWRVGCVELTAENLVRHYVACSVEPPDLIGQVRLGCGAGLLPNVVEEDLPNIDAKAAVQQLRGDFVPGAGE